MWHRYCHWNVCTAATVCDALSCSIRPIGTRMPSVDELSEPYGMVFIFFKLNSRTILLVKNGEYWQHCPIRLNFMKKKTLKNMIHFAFSSTFETSSLTMITNSISFVFFHSVQTPTPHSCLAKTKTEQSKRREKKSFDFKLLVAIPYTRRSNVVERVAHTIYSISDCLANLVSISKQFTLYWLIDHTVRDAMQDEKRTNNTTRNRKSQSFEPAEIAFACSSLTNLYFYSFFPFLEQLTMCTNHRKKSPDGVHPYDTACGIPNEYVQAQTHNTDWFLVRQQQRRPQRPHHRQHVTSSWINVLHIGSALRVRFCGFRTSIGLEFFVNGHWTIATATWTLIILIYYAITFLNGASQIWAGSR